MPDNLKLLPIYLLSVLKTPAFKLLYNCKLDDKIAWMYKVMSMPHSISPYFMYPRIYRVTDIGSAEADYGQYAEGAQLMSKPLCYPASMEKLGSKDAYLVDNADYVYLYLGNQVDDTFIQNVSNTF